MEKQISSDMTTEYEPDLPWNRWKRQPVVADPKTSTAADPGEERPKAERLRVVIEWPTIEESNRLAEAGSSSAISLAYAKRCIVRIINPGIAGVEADTGEKLLALTSRGRRKAWQLAMNVGSHIFTQSFLTEEEEKN